MGFRFAFLYLNCTQNIEKYKWNLFTKNTNTISTRTKRAPMLGRPRGPSLEPRTKCVYMHPRNRWGFFFFFLLLKQLHSLPLSAAARFDHTGMATVISERKIKTNFILLPVYEFILIASQAYKLNHWSYVYWITNKEKTKSLQTRYNVIKWRLPPIFRNYSECLLLDAQVTYNPYLWPVLSSPDQQAWVRGPVTMNGQERHSWQFGIET